MKARGFGIAIVTLLSYASLVFSSSSQSTSRHPSGILTGRVVDDEGRPMRGAQVQALIFGYQNGSREALPRGNTATTNDRGEFRIFWLETGMYYLVVHPNATSDPLSLLSTRTGLAYTPSDPDATFVTTYFPGTPDSRKPESIQVGPGELDVHAIQVAALPTRLIRIRIVNPKLMKVMQPVLMGPVRQVQPAGAGIPGHATGAWKRRIRDARGSGAGAISASPCRPLAQRLIRRNCDANS